MIISPIFARHLSSITMSDNCTSLQANTVGNYIGNDDDPDSRNSRPRASQQANHHAPSVHLSQIEGVMRSKVSPAAGTILNGIERAVEILSRRRLSLHATRRQLFDVSVVL